MVWPDGEDEEKVVWEDCHCVSATEKAIKVVGVEEKPVWIPQSQIHDDSEVYRLGDKGVLAVKRWFAEKQGWV